MQIPGVPDAIDRAALRKSLEDLGFDPDGIESITVNRLGVAAKVYVRDEDGSLPIRTALASTYDLPIPLTGVWE